MTDTSTRPKGFLRALTAGAAAPPSPVLIYAERLEAGFNRSLEGLATNATIDYSRSAAAVVRAFGARLDALRIHQSHDDGRGAGRSRLGGGMGGRVS